MRERWAVVSGGSSGIGAAIATELAALRYSLLLLGRDREALERQISGLHRHGVEVLTLAGDLATESGLEQVKRFTDERSISVEVLVNNAGFGLHAPFLKNDLNDVTRMLDLQLKGMLVLTRFYLPGMVERRCGYLLNVASVYAFSPVPNQAVYAASKAFMLSFSRTLALELAQSGVSVSVLCPGITRTNFRTRAGMQEKRSAFALSAEEVAKVGVRGMLKRRPLIVPGWHNKLYTTLASCLPAGALGQFTRWFNRRRGIAGEIREPS